MERLQFSLDADFKSVGMVRNRVRAVLLAHFGSDALACVDDFCLIVSELLNNGVEHGACSMLEGDFAITADAASFTLITKGEPFDPTATAATMPELDHHGELPEGGYGLAIIRQLADTFTYEYLDGRNMVTVSKSMREKHG